jgi:hypothetical protein
VNQRVELENTRSPERAGAVLFELGAEFLRVHRTDVRIAQQLALLGTLSVCRRNRAVVDRCKLSADLSRVDAHATKCALRGVALSWNPAMPRLPSGFCCCAAETYADTCRRQPGAPPPSAR